MFTQMVGATVSTLQGVKSQVVPVGSFIRKFATKNSQKISAFLLASKMFSVAIVLSIVPLSAGKVSHEHPVYKTEIKFDQSIPLALVDKNRQVAIASGVAQIDASKQIAQVSIAADYAPSVEREPSYFRDLYRRAGAVYNIPWQLLEAVHYTETGCSDSTYESSYAGATGPMQFMPGTWRTYGVDANGDGEANIGNVEDAVFGAANLLANSGAAEGNIDGALFNYNHAQWYVDKVKSIAYDAGMTQ